MEKKKNIKKIMLLIILGLIILLNLVGLIIESLISFKIIQTDQVKLRPILSPTTILSLAFIISGIIFWIRFYKNKKDTVLWWNIFIATAILIILSKIIWPTIMTTLTPYYFIIIPLITLIIWYVIFKYLKNKPS